MATITPEILQNMDEMVKMMSEQNGVGLAAPQVGVLQRFLVMMNPDTNEIFKMINPVIVSRSAETVVMEEGCLSVLGPDGLPVYANVTRPAVVTVEWTDTAGQRCAAEMSGLPARIVQHETDHLDVWQDQAEELVVEHGRAVGVRTIWGAELRARSVVVTAGTFLNGLMHIGR